MTHDRQVLELAGHAGTILLQNGAEIYRVQETMIHILKAYEARDFNVYVISNGIFASVDEHSDEPLSLVRHVPLGSMNLSRIDAVNQVSRDIAQGRLTLEEAENRLAQAETLTPEKPWVHVLASGFGAAGFCCLFGGTLTDALAALPIGLLLQLYFYWAGDRRVAKFIPFIFGSLMVTVLAGLCCQLWPDLQFGKVVIGGIIPMVPGTSFSISFREFFNDDYLSGIIHLIAALLTAACMALGVSGGMVLLHLLGGLSL